MAQQFDYPKTETQLREIQDKLYQHSKEARDAGDRPAFKGLLEIMSAGYYWIVEGDISKCFDRIDHSILLKRLYHMGVKDRRVLQIIKAMLKAGVMGECEVNAEGTPQGGLISPLLANVYLDIMDEWITKQWELKHTQYQYAQVQSRYAAMRKRTHLIPGCLVRYADDFVIITDTRAHAKNWKIRLQTFLQNKMKLTLSQEKTLITDIRKKHIKFLGYEFKMVRGKSRRGYIPRTIPDRDRLKRKADKIAEDIKKIPRNYSREQMIGASGVGKTAFFLYPNMEYACASGMSFLALDTKGDLARNYGAVALQHYGYKVAVIDLRNPTRSDGYNLLTLINRYMDICREQPSNLAARAKAEKYAKILAKTIINPEGDAGNYGQNQFFYDSAEGLLTAVVLLLAEYLPPTEEAPQERRHIVSVFKLVQDLLAPSKTAKGKNGFQVMMDTLPDTHKARWFAGAALNSAEQAMASVMSMVLSRLNAFLDSELEQVLCFDSAIDAEAFASRKSAIFLVLPEEDPSKNFMAGLMIQTLSRELFSVADENGGKLPNRVVLFCDELGTMPAFDILPLFSAGRSRKLTLVPIIQSLAQLEKNYGKEGSEIIQDNVQDTIFGGFAPNSQTAEVLSKALGSRTVMSGSVSKGGGKTAPAAPSR